MTEKIGVSRLADRGDAWFPLRIGRTYYNSLNQRVLEVMRTSGDDADHNFEYGKVGIAVCRQDRWHGASSLFGYGKFCG